ncbi:MAG: aldehyde dehydrogenase family protein [Halofilum sp. (in: g-proteobacteria)]|nr:aldehyde dehydrogenase family protein [Halofilum sp. (in: g-proteobacteria)]
MTIAREEIFGPVLTIIGYDDEDEAVRIANDTPYGLAANVSSGDPERARRVAARLRAGQVRINDAGVTSRHPFGGYKQSGNGREGGPEGFRDFLETKALVGLEWRRVQAGPVRPPRGPAPVGVNPPACPRGCRPCSRCSGRTRPVKMLHSVRLPDHVGLPGPGRYRHVPRRFTTNLGHPVQRVAAEEELHVTGTELERLHASAVTVHHRRHGVVMLVLGVTDSRDVLEEPTGLRGLDHPRHGELVGVEVPRKRVAGLHGVEWHAGQRIRVAVERVDVEGVGYEVREDVALIQPHQIRFGIDEVGTDEAVGPLLEPVDGVSGTKILALFAKVRVVRGALTMSLWCQPLRFQADPPNGIRLQECRQGAAAVLGQRLSTAFDQFVIGRSAGRMDRIPVRIEDHGPVCLGGHFRLPRWSGCGTSVGASFSSGKRNCQPLISRKSISRWLVNIDHMRTFLEVAATGDFQLASDRLNVTQSTVSTRIKVLEQRLDGTAVPAAAVRVRN